MKRAKDFEPVTHDLSIWIESKGRLMNTGEVVLVLAAWFVGAFGLCIAFMKTWLWLQDREDRRAR